MKQFAVAYFCYHEGCISQKIITDISKECAIQKMLISKGWEVQPDDCTEANLHKLADMTVSALQISVFWDSQEIIEKE